MEERLSFLENILTRSFHRFLDICHTKGKADKEQRKVYWEYTHTQELTQQTAKKGRNQETGVGCGHLGTDHRLRDVFAEIPGSKISKIGEEGAVAHTNEEKGDAYHKAG
jgi:hypothetical protein